MKKLFIYTVFSFVILFATISACAQDDIKALKDIGIFDSDVSEDENVTVQNLCKIASKLISKEDVLPVESDDVYSGYTDFMRKSGMISDGQNPTDYANGELACKMYLYAMGYYNASQSYGGTYISFATKTGIMKGVSISGDTKITYGNISKMTMNALTEKMADVSISAGGTLNTKINSGSDTILSKIYEISVYEGIINDVNDCDKSVNTVITRNVYPSNRVYIPVNSKVSYKSAKTFNPYNIKNAPSVLWVHDNVIVSAYLKSNVNVRFEVVSSVNGDENKNSAYSPSNISKIMFYDDKKEYKPSDSFSVGYNEEETEKYTPIKIIGKYVRTVFVDDKLTYLESWKLTNFGLVNNVNDDTIYYTENTTTDMKFKKFSDYSFVKVIINGEYLSVGSIKPGCVFSWYEYDGGVVIFINEKVVSAKLEEISEEYVRLGDINYIKADKIYISKDSKKFSSDYDVLYECLKNDMSAYFNINNEVCYITPVKNGSLVSNTFMGIVTGYKYKEFENIRTMEILNLESDSFERKIYTVRDKAVLENSITYEDISSVCGTVSNNAIFQFTVNDSGEITKIKSAYLYRGISSATTSFSRFSTDDVYSSLTVSGDVIYLLQTPFVSVYTDYNGKICAKREAWSRLYGKNASGVNVTIYGYDDTTDPRIVILTGKTQNVCYYETYYGVVKGKSLVVNNFSEKCFKVTILSNQGEDEYILPYDEGIKLSNLAYVEFQKNFYYDESRTVKITKSVNLSDDFDSWDMNGFRDGKVLLKGSNSFMAQYTNANGETMTSTSFLHPYYCFVAVYENGKITKGDMSDITIGDHIYYFYTGGDTRIIFTEK